MPPQRSTRAGIAPGVKLQRNSGDHSEWGWVFTEVSQPANISQQHRLAAYGFAERNAHRKPICVNKHVPMNSRIKQNTKAMQEKLVQGELQDDAILEISDSEDEVTACTASACKANPNCINYLSQAQWKDESTAQKKWIKAARIGTNPAREARIDNYPVGLRNLGATCYANAFLQVWFQDLAFRAGVYSCSPTPIQDTEAGPSSPSAVAENSPIFQLQVTFAALQNLKQNVFNPVKLVDSLMIKASEQQDAQEFSKLFMTLLGQEFEKQSIPALKSLVSDQFEGKQVYGTRCKTCNTRSERESDFLELELNLESNCKLEDCISRLLQSETLSGDNQYRCSQCDALRDAVRYTEIKSLPPVLHFSLLRFGYDVNDGSRKKSKHAIRFPLRLVMDEFVGEGTKGGASRGRKEAAVSSPAEVFELKGVLLHKGPSAYHGHYEAQVYDVVNQAWYQFNDEEVSDIDPVEEARQLEKKATKAAEKANGSSKKPMRIMSEEIEPPTPTETGAYLKSKDAYMLIYTRVDPSSPWTSSRHCPRSPSPDPITIKHDAKKPPISKSVDIGVPQPPLLAQQAVEKLNMEYEKQCAEYNAKKEVTLQDFRRVRSEKMAIFQSWNIQKHNETSIVVDNDMLKDWLAEGLVVHKDAKEPAKLPPAPSCCEPNLGADAGSDTTLVGSPSPQKPTTALPLSLASSPTPEQQNTPLDAEIKGVTSPSEITSDKKENSPCANNVWDNSGIVCLHGKLDPDKSGRMKRINIAAYERMVALDERRFTPELTSNDVCADCVLRIFNERLYTIEHPAIVSEFDESNEEDPKTIYISKRWLSDWRRPIPKMHDAHDGYIGDPPPDAPLYAPDVFCEHGGLIPNVTHRVRINGKAAALLTNLFPQWKTLTTDTLDCVVCTDLRRSRDDDSKQLKTQAEAEKMRMKYVEHSLTADTLEDGVRYAMVDHQFVDTWRRWVLRPAVHPRPTRVDISPFLCEHGLLSVDLNYEADVSSSLVAFVSMQHWAVIQENYATDQTIPVDVMQNADGTNILTSDIGFCAECRQNRLRNWTSTKLTVVILGAGDPVPNPDLHAAGAYAANAESSPARSRKPLPDPTIDAYYEPIKTYGKGRKRAATPAAPTRVSKRLKTAKKPERKAVDVEITDTLKDLKVKLQDGLSVPTIYQKIYREGVELTNNSLTLGALEILASDTLVLHADKPLDDDDDILLFSDDEGTSHNKNREATFSAFGGSLLGGRLPVKAPSEPAEDTLMADAASLQAEPVVPPSSTTTFIPPAPPAEPVPTPTSHLTKSTPLSAVTQPRRRPAPVTPVPHRKAPVASSPLSSPPEPKVPRRVSSAMDVDDLFGDNAPKRICAVCTFANPDGVSACTICEASFEDIDLDDF